MKHMDLADYMRENYSIVVDKNSSRFAKFLAKYTAYSLDDRVVSSAKEVKTEGYIEITSECKLVVEDILYNLVKLQTEKEVAVAFTPGKKLIIIGGGYIGLETAAVACKMGLETTVIEAADRVLARVTDPVMSAFYQRVHAEEGVTILTGTGVAGLHGTEDTVSGVELSDGRILEADCVVVGIGIVPNTELAEAAGLDVDNGIVVNDVARTSHPDIYAAGDCTQHPNDLLGRRLRLESVQNAIEQGKAAASDILGTPVAYHQIPWFWSDQYDVKLQIVGMSGDHDKIVTRGDLNSRSFAVFYFKGDQLTAVDAVNRPGEFMVAKKQSTVPPRATFSNLTSSQMRACQLKT